MDVLDAIDTGPYKEAAAARKGSIYVYVSLDNMVESTINLSMVTGTRSYLQVTEKGKVYKWAPHLMEPGS